MIRDGPLSALRWRILLAFIVVAVLCVGVVTVLTVASTRTGVEALLGRDHARTTQAVAEQVAAAYRAAGGWERADLSAARAIADAAGAHFAVVQGADARTSVAVLPRPLLRAASDPPAGVAGSPARRSAPTAGPTNEQRTSPAAPVSSYRRASTAPTPSQSPGDPRRGSPVPPPPSTSSQGSVRPPPPTTSPSPTPPSSEGELPVTVDGSTVGAVVVTYPAENRADAAALEARNAILDQVALAAVLALAIAAAVSGFVARRIARPVTALTAAAEAVERGERDPALPVRAPGELGRLARTFAHMATGLASAERARRAVVADVAHELRTPVTILRGNLEGMVDGVADPTPEALQSLHDEVLELARVLDDLAALAAADEATFRLERHALDLARVADSIVEMLGPSAADAGIRLESSLTPTPIVGDETRLHQVLLNLVGNALKFSQDGGTVKVCVRPDGDDAEVTVTDDGPGIPPDELPHVFERFWRGERTVGTTGSGIGLAVVKQLVDAHGGTVHALSPAGGGACFVVRLPVLHTGQASAPSPEEQ